MDEPIQAIEEAGYGIKVSLDVFKRSWLLILLFCCPHYVIMA